jgi:hypothetical protein
MLHGGAFLILAQHVGDPRCARTRYGIYIGFIRLCRLFASAGSVCHSEYVTRILVTFILIVSVAFAATSCYASSDAQDQTSSAQPNIVYVVTDDMRKDDLAYMPKTQSLIFDEGITYDGAFVTTSQCCPSRSSMLRGQYAHNTGVKANKGPSGGWGAFRKNEDSTIATCGSTRPDTRPCSPVST